MKLKRRNKVKAEFNMSSMTDIMFMLLIFFIITSKFTPEPILKVVLPKGAESTKVKQTIKIYITEKLEYSIDSKIISFDRLPFEMNGMLSQKPGATVSIHSDQSVEYGKVMDMLHMVHELGGKPVLALKPAK